MPAKGATPRERYLEAIEAAVKLWGREGQVRSALILGLEPLESTLEGIDQIARRGAMPILSPFRPVPGTPMEDAAPPSADELFVAWKEGQRIAEVHGQVLGPLCKACQNNTVALPVSDRYRYY